METPTTADAGFSLVEAVLAMVLLALMTLGVMPLMIGATQASSGNTDLVAANELANQRLAAIRAQFPDTAENSCTLLAASAVTGAAGPAGSDIVVDVSIDDCPAAAADYPAAVRVTASVRETAAADTPIATVPTEILVTIP